MTRTHTFTAATRIALATVLFACTAHAGAQDVDTDPPTRVARLSYASGSVSFSPAGSDEWLDARLNRPMIAGDRLWADANSRAELAMDDSTWWIGDATSVTLSNLDDRIVQMQVQEGTLDVRVRSLPEGNIVEVDTPNLAFSVTRPGDYRFDVDGQDQSTAVFVRNGEGDVYGESASYVITDGQAYRFYGTDVRDSEFVAPPAPDAFDGFVLDRDRVYTSAASLRYVSPTVVGYEDLDRYGAWSPESGYGDVWFPRVSGPDWAPYREGHWAWVDPWGWTWVDDEPWGFAPFHYGRWAHFDRGWGWVPGPRSVRAVYAPALVVFVGGAGASFALASGPAIGWFPLAPREVYVPPYHVSRNYFQQVNVTNTVVNVTNITNVYNNPSRIAQVDYRNRRAPNAVTAVPPAAFAQAQSVQRVAMQVPAAALARAQPRAVAAVAPARQAFAGAAPVARAKPPAAALQRAVVAKAPPPPPAIPDTQKLKALERNPGHPLTAPERQALRSAAPAAAAARAPVKVVTQPKPAPTAAPPARQARERPAGAPRPPQAPPVASPAEPARRAPSSEPRERTRQPQPAPVQAQPAPSPEPRPPATPEPRREGERPSVQTAPAPQAQPARPPEARPQATPETRRERERPPVQTAPTPQAQPQPPRPPQGERQAPRPPQAQPQPPRPEQAQPEQRGARQPQPQPQPSRAPERQPAPPEQRREASRPPPQPGPKPQAERPQPQSRQPAPAPSAKQEKEKQKEKEKGKGNDGNDGNG